MAVIAISNRVVARNSLGRFIADCEQAGHDTVDKLVERGESLSRRMAPKRSGALAASISSHMLSRTSGVWQAMAPYALFQERGTTPHIMIGNEFFSFFWDEAGRMWVPGLFGSPDIINHPGNPPQPFLRPAYEAVMAMAMSVARSQYPG